MIKNIIFSHKTLIFCLLLHLFCIEVQAAVTDSQVANWKGNKTAVFLLMFDDGLNSHYQVLIPELLKRKMIATLYVNPGGNKWPNPAVESPNQWENLIPKTGMVYGDHTWTHNGAADLATEDNEIRLCKEKIMSIFYPDGKPHLISYGQPGVTTWFSYGAELTAILAKYNLISRPTFDGHGTVYHLQTIKQMLALADKAIAGKGMEYLITHGVERRVSEGDPNWGFQDFWALNKDTLRGVLDGLATRRDNGQLWITDHISWYKYQMERDNKPTFQVQKSETHEIQLTLTGSLDQGLYDLPLTVITQVPATWLKAFVTIGLQSTVVDVVNGTVMYDVLPNGALVTLTENTDTEAPSVPDGLISSAITGTSFALSWTASTDNINVTGYDVFQNGVLIGSTTSNSLNVTGLVYSTAYAMTVKAKDATSNVSGASTALNVTTLAPPPVQKYEAENAGRSGGIIAIDHAGYSGTGFWASVSTQGNNLQFNVYTTAAGLHSITCRYANGVGAVEKLSLYVNGIKIRQVSYPLTTNWDTWADKIDNVTLNSGNNTIKYQFDSGDNGRVNIDYILVQSIITTESVSPIAVTDNQGIVVFKNANNQIVINNDNTFEQQGMVIVCNAIGQKLISVSTTGNNTVINRSFGSGVYFVTVTVGRNKITKKIIIN